MKKDKIADRININCIRYETKTRFHSQRFLVNFAKSNNLLSFNKKTVTILEIGKWQNVIVGYEAKANVIVLKNADAEEYGAVCLRDLTAQDRQKRTYKTGGKCVNIGHMINSFGIVPSKQYRPERNGDLMLLEPIE